jgi:dephospho-CoA kinase
MIKVGLSGNRYSGKNRVATLFHQIGVPVFEADVILKFIINNNYELQGEIADKIGRVCFNKEGLLDHNKIISGGNFSKILDVVEPELYKAWKKFTKKNYKSIYCIFHSSILFEREWNSGMDLNISVFSPYADRVDRCKYLTNKSVSSIYSLSKLEMDELDKNKLSEYVIHNYNDDSPFYGDALTQVNKIDNQIINTYLKGKTTSKKELAL